MSHILTNPLVSVCVPTHNGARYLIQALESIERQTYNNLEIIISDDGSSDETVEIIQQFNESRLRLFLHDRLGIASNWNFCIRQSRGKYIKFLFQDDLLHKTCIEMMVRAAEQNPTAGLIFSKRVVLAEENLSYVKSLNNLHLAWTYLEDKQSGTALLEDRLLCQVPYNKIGEPTNLLIPADVFKKIGGFDQSFQQFVDLEMWFRIMMSYDVVFIDNFLSSFRVHSSQATSVHNQSKDESWAEIYRLWIKMLFHQDFHRLPHTIHRRLRQALLLNLLKESLKMTLKQEMWKTRTVFRLILQLLRENTEGYAD